MAGPSSRDSSVFRTRMSKSLKVFASSERKKDPYIPISFTPLPRNRTRTLIEPTALMNIRFPTLTIFLKDELGATPTLQSLPLLLRIEVRAAN